MSFIKDKLINIYNHNNNLNVLDLGCGDGFYSIFFANNGSNVVAVDNYKMKNFQPTSELMNHSKIRFIKDDIFNFIKTDESSYDTILLLNVIVFLKKNFFLENVLPNILDRLNINGRLYLSFFFDDDKTISQYKKLSFYRFDDFVLPDGYKILSKYEEIKKDNHLPHGEHEHHVGYLEIIKI